jgi:hypothetical protein
MVAGIRLEKNVRGQELFLFLCLKGIFACTAIIDKLPCLIIGDWGVSAIGLVESFLPRIFAFVGFRWEIISILRLRGERRARRADSQRGEHRREDNFLEREADHFVLFTIAITRVGLVAEGLKAAPSSHTAR